MTIIQKDSKVTTAIHFEEDFFINEYKITLTLAINTESAREQNIAMDRALYILEDVLSHSILIYTDDSDALEKYREAGIRICELPEEPYDQIIALCLLAKLNTVMEGRLAVTELTLSSRMGDNVRYKITDEQAEEVLDKDGWWNESSDALSYQDMELDSTDKKITALFQNTVWDDVGLNWKENTLQ